MVQKKYQTLEIDIFGREFQLINFARILKDFLQNFSKRTCINFDLFFLSHTLALVGERLNLKFKKIITIQKEFSPQNTTSIVRCQSFILYISTK